MALSLILTAYCHLVKIMLHLYVGCCCLNTFSSGDVRCCLWRPHPTPRHGAAELVPRLQRRFTCKYTLIHTTSHSDIGQIFHQRTEKASCSLPVWLPRGTKLINSAQTLTNMQLIGNNTVCCLMLSLMKWQLTPTPTSAVRALTSSWTCGPRAATSFISQHHGAALCCTKLRDWPYWEIFLIYLGHHHVSHLLNFTL